MKLKEFKYFYPEKPVLMHRDQKSFQDLSKDPDWIAEPKYNGSRLMLWVIDGKPMFYSRHGEKLSYSPSKEILEKFKDFSEGYFLFDGELRHNKVVGIKDKIILWDCLVFKNKLLTKIPYRDRREMYLKKYFVFDENINIIEQFSNNFEKVFDSFNGHEEFEGIVLKYLYGRLNLSRTSNQKSRWMFKVRYPSGRYKF